MELSCRVNTADGSLFLISAKEIIETKIILDSSLNITCAKGVTVDDERNFMIEILLGTNRDAVQIGAIEINLNEARRASGVCLIKDFKVEGTDALSQIVFKVTTTTE